jgi:hypothetical protein
MMQNIQKARLQIALNKIIKISNISLNELNNIKPIWRYEVLSTICISVTAYSFFFRSYHVADFFWLLGDQIRDWDIAQNNFWNLPLVGTPRNDTVGGYHLGPIFYWILWLIRYSIGGYFDNLPHVGGISFAFIHALSDGFLLFGLLKRNVPIPLAALGILILINSPFGSSISGVIWNPELAVPIVNFAIGIFLLTKSPRTLFQTCLISTIIWLAVQTHTPAIITSALIPYLIIEVAVLKNIKSAIKHLVAISLIILILQIPYFIYSFKHINQFNKSTAITKSLVIMISQPFSLHFQKGLDFVVYNMGSMLAFNLGNTVLLVLFFLSCGLICLYFNTYGDIFSITVLPVWTAIFIFMYYQSQFDSYYLLSLMTSFSFLLLFGIFQMPWQKIRRLSGIVSLLLLIIMMFKQEQYLNVRFWGFHHPHYSILVKGARKIVKDNVIVKNVEGPKIHESENPTYLVKWLGGKVTPKGGVLARIKKDGTVEYIK